MRLMPRVWPLYVDDRGSNRSKMEVGWLPLVVLLVVVTIVLNWTKPVLIVWYLFFVPFVIWVWFRPAGWRKQRRRAIADRKCPMCQYRLAEIPPEPDGCTVCPECGAAWRLGEEGTKARSHEGTKG